MRSDTPEDTDTIAGVEGHLDHLDVGLMLLAERLEDADRDLISILRPPEPAITDNDPDSPAGRRNQSPLAIRLDAAVARLTTLTDRVAELLNRVDL